MAVLLVNDKQRRVEYVAQVAETTFVYDWSIFADGDLDVYIDEVLKILNVDYTVTNAGITDGGDVIFTVAMVGGEAIVIVGNLAIDQTVDFTNKANFTGKTVQTQFNKLTIISEELNTTFDQRGVFYNVFADLKVNSADNILPVLAANQFWQMNATATGIAAVEFEIDPGANTLRSELISKQSGSDGALIVGYFSVGLGEILLHDFLARLESKTNGSDGASQIGYFDASDATEKTVKDKLDTIVEQQLSRNIIIGGDFTTNPFQRGSAFNPIANDEFPADRFKYNQVGSMVLQSSVETVNPPPVSLAGIFVNKYVRLEVLTGSALGVGDFVTFKQNIEGFNWTRIAQRKFTVSFLVRSKITGTFAVAFKNFDDTISNVSNFTIDVADTWEQKSIIVEASPAPGNWNYENGIGIQAIITLASGSNFQTSTLNSWESANDIASTTQTNFAATIGNTIDFSLIQIEEGEQASEFPFEIRHFSTELELCQRYFVKTYDTNVNPGTITDDGVLVGMVQNSSLNRDAGRLQFYNPVSLRITPSIPNINIFSNVTGALGFIRNQGIGLDVGASVVQRGQLDNYISPNASQAINSIILGHITIDVEL